MPDLVPEFDRCCCWHVSKINGDWFHRTALPAQLVPAAATLLIGDFDPDGIGQ
jgi:hypothetical protein